MPDVLPGTQHTDHGVGNDDTTTDCEHHELVDVTRPGDYMRWESCQRCGLFVMTPGANNALSAPQTDPGSPTTPAPSSAASVDPGRVNGVTTIQDDVYLAAARAYNDGRLTYGPARIYGQGEAGRQAHIDRDNHDDAQDPHFRAAIDAALNHRDDEVRRLAGKLAGTIEQLATVRTFAQEWADLAPAMDPNGGQIYAGRAILRLLDGEGT